MRPKRENFHRDCFRREKETRGYDGGGEKDIADDLPVLSTLKFTNEMFEATRRDPFPKKRSTVGKKRILYERKRRGGGGECY